MKWVLPLEPHRENAAKLKEDFLSGIAELCAPSFMVQEVTNALWKAVKLKRTFQEDAKDALETLNDLQIEFLELDWPQASQALTIACKLDLAIYDAAYLFLAEETGSRLITADNKLYEKAKGQFELLHIKDYS